ncbi:hypothetical protein CW745_04030 [Psychromonas sp. psych-6C06]|uniref:NosD domain-containing protein n=1 Tax=Psychromonas sp. psych-6C06 TaxID=2058089 RepID=UPI000C32C072|nr:NosD domain-containing protein [Psychromonas sp. psych-6C06]PKF62598.1 hypothetical protein CW745_04030 [Psychromonas sp. psych-6C06]
MSQLIKLVGIFALLFFISFSYAQPRSVQALIERFQLPAFEKIVFVDKRINASCDNYDPKTRRCGNGQYQLFTTLKQATQQATAGTLFFIREGDYQEPLHIIHSGRDNSYIGFVAYQGEKVRLLNTNSVDKAQQYGPLWIDQSDYNLISGLEVSGSVGFGRLLNSHHNIIHDAQFIESSLWNEGRGKSKRGGLYIAFSHFNKITDSYFYKGTDSLALVHSDHNLIENNRMDLAGHDIWNIKCGNYNVIRGNEFSNKQQKIGSVFDCEAATMSWHGNGTFAQADAVLDRTRHNIIEHNLFHDAVRYYSASGGNGIQYAGQTGIIRFNQFYRTNVGIGITSYPSEALYNYDNRIYHNTFYNNWCVGIGVGKEIKIQRGNEIVNNILWNNQGVSRKSCTDKNAKQLLFSKKFGNNWFFNNNIGSVLGEQVIGVWGDDKHYSIYDYEGSYLAVQFDQNIAKDPLFESVENDNFQLTKNSPMVDAGTFLTTITSKSGQGKLLQVKDARFFSAGHDIKGLAGDVIEIKRGNQLATIVQIDYVTHSLILDRVVNWQEGDSLSLSYQGKAPDLGALEYGVVR